MTIRADPLAAQKAAFPDIPWIPLKGPQNHPRWTYHGFHPDTEVKLPVGHRREPKVPSRAFDVETTWLRDTAIRTRDGTILRADIFLPAGEGVKVPAVLVWSQHGKTGSGTYHLETAAPYGCGIAPGALSGYETFGGVDPADWVERGYAVINVDARGCGNSEGDIQFWGEQDALDIYDTLDWISSQKWSSGAVVMAGVSWLGVPQINFVSRYSHPALKAVAPWDSLKDLYRHVYARGGRPHLEKLHKTHMDTFAGPGTIEDISAIARARPLFDEFWMSKKLNAFKIDTPLYQVATYSSQLHPRGSFAGFEQAKTKHKWLRVHPYKDWYDLYRPEMLDDLQRFFDFFARGEQNGWDKRPMFRVSLLGFDGSTESTVVERPYDVYPLPETKYRTYYLDGETHTLLDTVPSKQALESYEAHSLTASSDFTVQFNERLEMHGDAKVKLWVSCDEHDDLDIVVQLRKIGVDGQLLSHLNYPIPASADGSSVPELNSTTYLGPEGYLRASHRITLVPADSKDVNQVDAKYGHDKREAVPKGTIVPLEIMLWPMGMIFGPGEGIMLRVAGHTMALPETDESVLTEPEDENVGVHKIHTGGEYDSYLMLPVIG